jgi:hypothetical protein
MDNIELKPNEKHKSSVFSLLFSKPEILRELYSAIEGVEIPSDIPISINTLSNALIKGRLNDISFLINERLIIILEQQSSINENMPLRILAYINRIYERISDYEKIYREKLIKIPRPEFIVLYNGEKSYPDKKELRLSDAFLDTEGIIENNRISLELIVQVYNINHGFNQEILKKCETLNSYSFFISKIREYQKTELDLAKSIEYAIKYCIENDILKEFLMEHGSEVSSWLYYEYDLDTHLRVTREEEREIWKAELQTVVAEKDAELQSVIADKDAEIARLQKQITEIKTK